MADLIPLKAGGNLAWNFASFLHRNFIFVEERRGILNKCLWQQWQWLHFDVGELYITLLQFYIFREFTKRMDPHLPFFYHTLNERFSVDLLPSFDEPPPGCESDHEDCDDVTKNPYRLHHLVRNTREDGSIFAAGRSFLPARNRTLTRQWFHHFDIGLPPVPQG